jgi:hypothetical protein
VTGAEHYDRAEQLVAEAVDDQDGTYPYPDGDPETANTIALAQVHATLALADAQRRATEALRKGTR